MTRVGYGIMPLKTTDEDTFDTGVDGVYALSKAVVYSIGLIAADTSTIPGHSFASIFKR
jgi:hypothetical protein